MVGFNSKASLNEYLRLGWAQYLLQICKKQGFVKKHFSDANQKFQRGQKKFRKLIV